MLDHAKEIVQGIMPSKRLLSIPLRTRRLSQQRGLKEGVMCSDGIICGMGMEDDNVLILDRLGVAGRMDRCFVRIIGSALESLRRGDKESGNIRKEGRESDERNYFHHNEEQSGVKKEAKKVVRLGVPCWDGRVGGSRSLNAQASLRVGCVESEVMD